MISPVPCRLFLILSKLFRYPKVFHPWIIIQPQHMACTRFPSSERAASFTLRFLIWGNTSRSTSDLEGLMAPVPAGAGAAFAAAKVIHYYQSRIRLSSAARPPGCRLSDIAQVFAETLGPIFTSFNYNLGRQAPPTCRPRLIQCNRMVFRMSWCLPRYSDWCVLGLKFRYTLSSSPFR